MASTATVHDRAHLRPPLRRAVLRARTCSSARSPRSTTSSPDLVVCSGDLTTFGFKHEYAQAKELPRPDRVRLARRDPRATTTRATSATSTSRSCSASATRCCGVGGVTVVAVDSTEPDLDHGQIGRGRYRWIEEQFAGRADLRDLRPPPPPAAGPGHRAASATSSTTPATRSSASSARASTSSSPATSTCRTRGGSRTCSSSTPARSRRCGCAGNTRPCYNVIEVDGRARRRLAQVPVPRAGADHPVLDRDARRSRSTRRGSRTR